MPNSISATGLTTATYTELLANYTTGLQTIYGPTVNLASDTPDGQWINIFIQSVLDLEDLLTQIYNTFDPDNAIGAVLDQRCAINGVTRQAGTFTTTNVSFSVASNYTVNLYGLDQAAQPIYTVADSAGNQWQLVTTQIGLTPGNYTKIFQAAQPGAVLTTPNTITIPVSIILGVTSINNPTTYINLGVNEESDAKLKIRRLQSVAIPSQGYFQSLIAALENINGITSAFVIENDTSGTDLNNIPGHSIWVIVAGSPTIPLAVAYNSLTTYSYGQIASSGALNYISVANNNTGNSISNPVFWQVYNPIAQAIYTYRNAGCGMYNSMDAGAQSYTIIQIDGSPFTVYWDTVINETLFIKMTLSSLNGLNPPNLSAITSFLEANFTPAVSAEVNINEVSTLVQLADPNALATFPSQGFSSSASGTYKFTKSPSAKNHQFSILGSSIILLPIILTCPNGVQVLTVQSDGSYLVTNTTVSIAHGGNTIQFSTIGGHQNGSFTYLRSSGAGTINPTSGLYTSSTAGTDIVLVTDDLGNTQQATITVT